MVTNFIDEVRTRSGRFKERLDALTTEESTKTSLVLPFIQMLGYDIFNPNQVVPEFTADVGSKRGEKVDYALMDDGRPVILIECKRYGSTLRDEMANQLLRYFGVTEAHFAILTDGVEYRFFSDLEEPNVMDTRPFFTFNMLSFTDQHVRDLERFTRAAFDEDDTYSAARNLKYAGEIQRAMAEEFAEPSDEFVRFIVRRVHEPGARISTGARNAIRSLVKPALTQFMHDRISDRFKTALAREEEPPPEPTPVDETPPDPEPAELEALEVVRAIVSDMVKIETLTLRPNKYSTPILVPVKNHQRVLCILLLRSEKKRIQLGYGAPRVSVESVEGIREHTDAIRGRLQEVTSAESDDPKGEA